MRRALLVIFSVIGPCWLWGQDYRSIEEGQVSYLSSQNVYVKFASTEAIAPGDTLFLLSATGQAEAALVVANKSSISCVCTMVGSLDIRVGDKVFARKKIEQKEETAEEKPPVAEKRKEPVARQSRGQQEEGFREVIKGRLAATSYFRFSDRKSDPRFRYTLSLSADHLRNTGFSFENYISFRHTVNEWYEVKDHLSDALKVYSLAVKYDLNPNSWIAVGRKMNPKISSLGAIDGVQFEKEVGDLSFGAIAGYRPDDYTQAVNMHLFELGAYAGYSSGEGKKYQYSTLGIVEQRNHMEVDRRFLFFQHSDALFKDLHLYGSFEVDLYEKANEEVSHQPRLTNLYVSLRYRPSRKLSFNAAYDTRKNIIYYETYKSFLENLMDQEARQGVRLGVSYRPIKYLSLGANANWRFRLGNLTDSRNANGYIRINQIPGVKMSAAVQLNYLRSSYVESRSIGLRLTKDLLPGKIGGEIYGSVVKYDYQFTEVAILQKSFGANFSFRILRTLSLYLFYEGVLVPDRPLYGRLNAKIVKRF